MSKRKLTEGQKMFIRVMMIFVIYAFIFILYMGYDRFSFHLFDEPRDWHMLLFSCLVMLGLGWVLRRYAKQMDERINREQEEKETEMRRELTHNIAHELKTPVASILGFMETLISNENINQETQALFIQRTYTQAQRLADLLKDVSILNRMDYAAGQLARERVNVSELVSDISKEVAISLAQHHMTFRNYLREDIVVPGNTMLLYSLFRNLFENSTNYAGEGTAIEISAEQDEHLWHFVFRDNGRGIADEHLPRIFERFFRIEKSRSRSLGGTGLGLAIAKNAVLMHGGTIMATHAEGGGLAFHFSLKK